jgi:hypothetical protein
MAFYGDSFTLLLPVSDMFSFPQSIQIRSRIHSAVVEWISHFFSLGLKRSECETDCSPASDPKLSTHKDIHLAFTMIKKEVKGSL